MLQLKLHPIIIACILLSNAVFVQDALKANKNNWDFSFYIGTNYSLAGSFINEITSGGFQFKHGIPKEDLFIDFPYAMALKAQYAFSPKLQMSTGIGLHNNFYEISFNAYKDPAAKLFGNKFSYLLRTISVPFLLRYPIHQSKFIGLYVDGGFTFNVNKIRVYSNSGRLVNIFPDTTLFALNYTQGLELENKVNIGGILGVDIQPNFLSKRFILRSELHIQRLNSFAFNHEMRLYNLDKGTEEYHFAKMDILPVFICLKLGYLFRNAD